MRCSMERVRPASGVSQKDITIGQSRHQVRHCVQIRRGMASTKSAMLMVAATNRIIGSALVIKSAATMPPSPTQPMSGRFH